MLAARIALGILWLYEGLGLKVVARDPHELDIVRSTLGRIGLAALPAMLGIGAAETFLAVIVLAGFKARAVGWFQLVVLVCMHTVATLSGALGNPLDLWVHCLPIYACIIVLIAAAHD